MPERQFMMAGMGGRGSLVGLMSQVLVALTIEMDNAFELRVLHRSTEFGGVAGAPWLVSWAMWALVLQYVPADGISAKRLRHATGMDAKSFAMWMTRLSAWWGYLQVGGKGAAAQVRWTAGGLRAAEVWRTFPKDIEERWQERFGEAGMMALRGALAGANEGLGKRYPEYMPMVGYGFRTVAWQLPVESRRELAVLPLTALLSRLLTEMAEAFEAETAVSLAIYANLMRRAVDGEVVLKDLPKRAGISKEAVAGMQKFLVKMEWAVVARQVLTLTTKGMVVARHAEELLSRIEVEREERWPNLREAVEGFGLAELLEGITPVEGNWRARVAGADGLPKFPVVTHRGGFPDGA